MHESNLEALNIARINVGRPEINGETQSFCACSLRECLCTPSTSQTVFGHSGPCGTLRWSVQDKSSHSFAQNTRAHSGQGVITSPADQRHKKIERRGASRSACMNYRPGLIFSTVGNTILRAVAAVKDVILDSFRRSGSQRPRSGAAGLSGLHLR